MSQLTLAITFAILIMKSTLFTFNAEKNYFSILNGEMKSVSFVNCAEKQHIYCTNVKKKIQIKVGGHYKNDGLILVAHK